MLTHHLGLVAAVTDANGTLFSQQKYMPFGQARAAIDPLPLISQTDFGFTG